MKYVGPVEVHGVVHSVTGFGISLNKSSGFCVLKLSIQCSFISKFTVYFPTGNMLEELL
jgi:hypothetical protein